MGSTIIRFNQQQRPDCTQTANMYKHVDTLRSYFRRSHSTLVATNTARDIGLMTRDLLISAKSIGIAMSMFHCRSLPISRKNCPSPTHSPAQFQQMHMCARACMHDCAMPLELKRDCVPVAVWMHSPRGVPVIISVSFNRASIYQIAVESYTTLCGNLYYTLFQAAGSIQCR